MINDSKNKKFQDSAFSKKKKPLENQEPINALVEEVLEVTPSAEKKTDITVKVESVVPVAISLEKKEVKKELDVPSLINDIANNKYFPLTSREARSIALRMVERGADSLLEINWFLTGLERRELLKQLKEKYSF